MDEPKGSQTCGASVFNARRIGAMNKRVVLDTNVLVSLLVFEDPRFAALAGAWIRGEIEVLSDAALRQEFERVLNYPAFYGRRPPEQALALYDGRVVQAEAVPDGLPLCRDPDDQKFLLLAAGGGADALITEDKQLLRMRRKLPFQIETPLSFQRRLIQAA
jgi:uncharacterized protein